MLRVLQFALTFLSLTLYSIILEIFISNLFSLKGKNNSTNQLPIWIFFLIFISLFWKEFQNVTCVTCRGNEKIIKT